MHEGDQTGNAQRPSSAAIPSGVIQLMRFAVGKDGAGVAGSLALHLLILMLLLFYWKKLTSEQAPLQHFVPVDLVALSQGPAAQPAQQKSAGVLSTQPHVR